MSQVKLLKIGSDGLFIEFDIVSDDITLNSFTAGAGPVMSPTGIDMNNTDLSDVQDVVFTNPTTGTINQTAGNLIIDDIMAKDRENTMTTSGSVAFPVVTDTAGQLDAFRLPAIAGVPTAAPTNGGEGHLVWNSSGDKLYAWNGTSWDDLSTVSSAESIDNNYIAEVAIAARDMVYISSADNVSKALGNAETTSRSIGFATTAASATAVVPVRSEGILTGFSGLTAGSRYYLSSTTAGAITPSAPTGTGHVIIQAGFAKSTTALHIQLDYLGRRAL